MLSNALMLLIYNTRMLNKHPDAPVFYTQQQGGDAYQIIVQKIPKQEVAAA